MRKCECDVKKRVVGHVAGSKFKNLPFFIFFIDRQVWCIKKRGHLSAQCKGLILMHSHIFDNTTRCCF